uniref:Uncharacterized protein n=1 Tax=Anguilla anguilla TaxID=7936 RepID=A0A0E9W8Z0_ANGAN
MPVLSISCIVVVRLFLQKVVLSVVSDHIKIHSILKLFKIIHGAAPRLIVTSRKPEACIIIA